MYRKLLFSCLVFGVVLCSHAFATGSLPPHDGSTDIEVVATNHGNFWLVPQDYYCGNGAMCSSSGLSLTNPVSCQWDYYTNTIPCDRSVEVQSMCEVEVIVYKPVTTTSPVGGVNTSNSADFSDPVDMSQSLVPVKEVQLQPCVVTETIESTCFGVR